LDENGGVSLTEEDFQAVDAILQGLGKQILAKKVEELNMEEN
jgi:hypothetical protein